MIKVTLNIILLFLASSLIPLGSFILPAYKIKKMPKLNSKNRLFTNLISGGVIYFIDDKLFFVYVVFFLLLEGLYYLFERTSIEIFDRIFISTTITTAMGYLLMRTFIGTPDDLMTILDGIYKEYLILDQTMITTMMGYIKQHLLVIVFTYSLVINYFTYFIVKGKTYREWNISYLWVLVYIITFLIDKTLKIDNFYVKNLYSITTLIYIIYGIKVLYSVFREKIGWRVYGKSLAIVTACFFPIGIFILGVMNSFGIIKINKRRK
ncbi:hypothetical protein [Psychrilyobacter sp.]|uniref:hypothetical protein n=1 Tax=Psychrilyobacter sp. TaxID=2586924 RepID=UPI003017C5D4